MFQKEFKSKLRADVNSVPPYLYGTIWKNLVQSSSLPPCSTVGVFKFESEIQRDINRTFPQLKFFRDPAGGQQELFNVLKAISIQVPEVGYCQGMGFIAGILLSHMSEQDAFRVFAVLITGELGGLYKPGLPRLNEYLQELGKMIETELPALSAHFSFLGIDLSMFASQWILSLFIYNLSFPKSLVLFNLFLIYGIKVILLFGLFVLSRMQSQLLASGFEECLSHINKGVDQTVPDMNAFMTDKSSFPS